MVYGVDFLCHPKGDPLANDRSSYAAVVVAGGIEGSMRDTERWPWLMREIAWLKALIEAGDRPMLDLCLGAQMIATAFGSEGSPRRDGLMELGFFRLS
tara:strand:- start:883 stop:1176 length:294 start_codon:yes stop_codon:yes gene_type:complete